jgi:hypothetical protein
VEISRRKFFFSMATAAVAAAVKPGQLLSPFEKKLWVPTEPKVWKCELPVQVIGVAVNEARSGEMLGISLAGHVVSMAFTPEAMRNLYVKVTAGADILPGSMVHLCGSLVYPLVGS